MSELTSLASGINSATRSLSQLGVDIRALEITGAAFQAIAGTGQIIKGMISAKEAAIAFKAAYGTAHLAKYTVGAGAVAALALAGGIAMGVAIETTAGVSDNGRGVSIIERAVRTDDSGAGMRALAGGHAYGRY